EIVIFDQLNEGDLTHIVEIQLARLLRRLESRKLKLILSDEAKRHIARDGFDPIYGARPLKRVIQKQILDPLSLELLEGKFREGDTIHADAPDGRIVFTK